MIERKKGDMLKRDAEAHVATGNLAVVIGRRGALGILSFKTRRNA